MVDTTTAMFPGLSSRTVRKTFHLRALFKVAISSSDCVVPNDTVMAENELERVWKEAIVA